MRTVIKYEHNSVRPLPCVRKISIWHIGNVCVFRFPTSVPCQDICDRPHGLQRRFGSTWKKHYCIASGSVIHSSNYKKQRSLLVCACHDSVLRSDLWLICKILNVQFTQNIEWFIYLFKSNLIVFSCNESQWGSVLFWIYWLHYMVKSSAIASQPLAHMQKKLRPPQMIWA